MAQAMKSPEKVAGPTAGSASFAAIYTVLRERISLLEYPPGTALSENTLAKEFGVSRTPIRRVLHRLEFDGLVSATHGVGTIVRSIDMMYLKQVYALRLKLIDLIAELSHVHVSDGDLPDLERLVDRARALHDARAPQELARVYLRYNEALTRAIGNEPLREITDRLFYQTSRVWLQLLPEMDWHEEVGSTVEEIGDVCAGLRARDLRRVSDVRRDHFVRCLKRINRHFAGADASGGPVLRGG